LKFNDADLIGVDRGVGGLGRRNTCPSQEACWNQKKQTISNHNWEMNRVFPV
jgi:hypothetical protein